MRGKLLKNGTGAATATAQNPNNMQILRALGP